MKLRVLSLLLAAILLTGCTQNTAEGNSSDTSSQTKETSAATADESETEENKSAAGETGAESEEAVPESEQEPFILTFEAATIDGEEVTSDCFADSKLTMLNVWATYCNPCLVEMPDLGEIAAEYDPAVFQMFGIVSDVIEGDEADKIEEAQALITQTNANYPHMLLNQSLYSNLVGGISSVPTTFFFNQDSELLGYVIGSQTKDTWVAIIEDLLSQME